MTISSRRALRRPHPLSAPTVLDTLADLIWCRPLEFGNRTQALAHLLLSPDNGYIWRNGHLVKINRTPRPALHDDAPSDETAVIDLRRPSLNGRERQELITRRRLAHRTLAASDGPFHEPGITGLCCDSTDLTTVDLAPADAVREWREAARELHRALQSHVSAAA